MSDTVRAWLDRAHTLDQAATPGPWFAEAGDPDDYYSVPSVYNTFHNGETSGRGLVAEAAYDNAEWIAHSRTALPAAVAAIRAILDLHTPTEAADGSYLCSVCAEADDCAYALPWPCPTVAAIHDKIGDET